MAKSFQITRISCSVLKFSYKNCEKVLNGKFWTAKVWGEEKEKHWAANGSLHILKLFV